MSTSQVYSETRAEQPRWATRFLFVEKRLDSVTVECHFVSGDQVASEKIVIRGIMGSSPSEIASDLQKLVDRLRLLDNG